MAKTAYVLSYLLLVKGCRSLSTFFSTSYKTMLHILLGRVGVESNCRR